jgi:hypothetical protein
MEQHILDTNAGKQLINSGLEKILRFLLALTFCVIKKCLLQMEQHTLKDVYNCLNTSIYSYLETSGGQSSNLFLNVVHFFNNRVN